MTLRRMKAALVTGGSGFIGSVLVRRLLQEGVQVACLGRSKERISDRLRLKELKVIETSFQTPELKAKLATLSPPPDTVFHLASYGVRPEDRDPEQLIEGNVSLVVRLLEAVRNWSIRKFIHVGSCSEYGFPLSDKVLISENHPLRAVSPYGAAKAAAGLFGNVIAHGWNIPFVTLRLFNVFGIQEGPQRLVPYLISHLMNHEPVDLTPGEQVRDLLYVEDVVEALLLAGESDAVLPREVYNICSAQPVRIRQVGETVAESLQKPQALLQWGKRPYRDDEPLWMVGDNRKFVDATSWRPEITWEEGIRRMISEAKIPPPRDEHQHAI